VEREVEVHDVDPSRAGVGERPGGGDGIAVEDGSGLETAGTEEREPTVGQVDRGDHLEHGPNDRRGVEGAER
jgi:hypothetical protein